MSAVLTIDKSKVRQSFASAANSYDELATLQRKVGLKLLQQFSQKDSCQQLVDIGCGTGFLTQQLIERHYSEQVIAIDIALSMLQKSKKKLE
ncbi:MAG: methyltransferase domain-containing protein, partial [Methylococcales bacterium]